MLSYLYLIENENVFLDQFLLIIFDKTTKVEKHNNGCKTCF